MAQPALLSGPNNNNGGHSSMKNNEKMTTEDDHSVFTGMGAHHLRTAANSTVYNSSTTPIANNSQQLQLQHMMNPNGPNGGLLMGGGSATMGTDYFNSNVNNGNNIYLDGHGGSGIYTNYCGGGANSTISTTIPTGPPSAAYPTGPQMGSSGGLFPASVGSTLVSTFVPTAAALESLLKDAHLPMVSRQHRIVRVNRDLLDLTRKFSPPIIGGSASPHFQKRQSDGSPRNTDSTDQSIPTLRGPHPDRHRVCLPEGPRDEAASAGLSSSISCEELAQMKLLLRQTVQALGMSTWAKPRKHQNFLYEGGWNLYLLKLHQLLVSCFEDFVNPSTAGGSDQTNLNEGDSSSASSPTATRASSHSGGFDRSNSPSQVFYQTNAYEAKSLWQAIFRLGSDDEGDNSRHEFPTPHHFGETDGDGQNINRYEESRVISSDDPLSRGYGYSSGGGGPVAGYRDDNLYREYYNRSTSNSKLSVSTSTRRDEEQSGMTTPSSVSGTGGVFGQQQGIGSQLLSGQFDGAGGSSQQSVVGDIASAASTAVAKAMDHSVSSSEASGHEGVILSKAVPSAASSSEKGAEQEHQTENALLEKGGEESGTARADEIANKPYELFVCLKDGAWDYLGLDTSTENLSSAGGVASHISPLCYPPKSTYSNSAKPGSPVQFVVWDESLRRVCFCVDVDVLTFAVEAMGRYDAYLWALVLNLFMSVPSTTQWRTRIPPIFMQSQEMVKKRAIHALRVFRDCSQSDRWNVAKCEYLSHMLLSSSAAAVEDAITDLHIEVWHASIHRGDIAGRKRLEGILVSLLGHSDLATRSRAAILLNNFYDGHDWQSTVPFLPVIRLVGDPFVITVIVDDVANPKLGETPRGVFLILSAPSFETHSASETYTYHSVDWQPSIASIKGRFLTGPRIATSTPYAAYVRHRWEGTVTFQNFPRCGFYDWRVVRVNEALGSWEVVQATLTDVRRSASSSRLLNLNISLNPSSSHKDSICLSGGGGGLLASDLKDSTATENLLESPLGGNVYPHPKRLEEVLSGLLCPSRPIGGGRDSNDTYNNNYSSSTAGGGGGGVNFRDRFETYSLQGRFIVQPKNAVDEQIHEIFIDQHGCQFDPSTGEVRQRGSFASVTASLAKLREQGVTTVYLMGALSRDHGDACFLNKGGTSFEREDASPYAVTCRATPDQMLGGANGILGLLKEAKRVGIKVLVDSLSRISSSRHHRKYAPYLLHYLDEQGKKMLLYGSGGRSAEYEDSCLLNYRKVEAWDLMLEDLRMWASSLGVHGVRLDSSQSWPQILQVDSAELNRRDPDGEPHYTVREKLSGDVVLPFTDDLSGFWSSQSARGWANPFFVKLCKETWRHTPQFMFVGECWDGDGCEGRESVLARSGLIPQLQDMPDTLARVFGHAIDKETSLVTKCPAANVGVLKEWFDASHNGLPEGAVVIQSSCSHASPLPGLLYGRGAWPATDLLFFLPDVPSTFAGEMEGRCFRLDVTNFFAVRSPRNGLTNSPHALSDASPISTSPEPPMTTATTPAPSSALRLSSSVSLKIPAQRLSSARSLVHLSDVGGAAAAAAAVAAASTAPSSARGLLSSRKPLSQIRSLARFEPVTSLPQLEAEHVKSVGPEFGFNLKKIEGHYRHRRALRHRFRIFRTGVFVPLNTIHNGAVHPSVLSFLRFDADNGEFVLVGINFSGVALEGLTVSVKALTSQFRDMGLQGGTTFVSGSLFGVNEEQTGGDTPEKSNATMDYSQRVGGTPSGVVPLGGCNTLATVFDADKSLVKEVFSMAELLHEPQKFNLNPYGSICLGFRPVTVEHLTNDLVMKLYSSSLSRLESIVRGAKIHSVVGNRPCPPKLERMLRSNFVMSSLIQGVASKQMDSFVDILHNLREVMAVKDGKGDTAETPPENATRPVKLHDICVDSGMFCSSNQTFNHEAWRALCSKEGGGARALLAHRDEADDLAQRLVAKLMVVRDKVNQMQKAGISVPSEGMEVSKFADEFLKSNHLGPIVFVTTELGKWSTVGGLGVMVDELSCTLAQEMGQDVWVVSPYYDRNRKGETEYLQKDNIHYKMNIELTIGGDVVSLGVHEGKVRGVNLIFLHNSRFFPRPYPDFSVSDGLRFLSVIGKSCLEVLCQKKMIPQLIITNDWPTGLCPAYAKNGHFGTAFDGTTFFHIVHNLDPSYEGRLYPDKRQDFSWIHGLPGDLLVDPLWSTYLYNPSRCALLTCDAWGTVSPSYRDDLKGHGRGIASPLAPLLNRYGTPFAYPNGVPLKLRLKRLSELPVRSHHEAKSFLQKKYFGYHTPDLSVPLFAFIGRITSQKGVHHIVEAAEQLFQRYQCKIQILIGGKVTWSDPYGKRCGHAMQYLREKYPFSFWADPNEFFTDGPVVNLGADVGLMPSAFEPGGIVQHEFFLAGTPVLAFRTGGLKDTVYEFDIEKQTGNGFTFEAYALGDFLYAMERAYRIVIDPQKYARLRENAKYSVVSCEQVAQAWLLEFCRLRRKIPVDQERAKTEQVALLPAWDPVKWSRWCHTISAGGTIPPRTAPEDSVPSLLGGNGPIYFASDGRAPVTSTTSSLKGSSVVTGTTTTPTATAAIVEGESGPVSGVRDLSSRQLQQQQRELGVRPVRIRYVPKSAYRPRAVAVSGSFDGWQIRRPMSWDNALQAFTLNIALKTGTYYYKLVVDGDWVCNEDEKVTNDAAGYSNNVLVVV